MRACPEDFDTYDRRILTLDRLMHPRGLIRLPFLYWKTAKLAAFLRNTRNGRAIQRRQLMAQVRRSAASQFGCDFGLDQLSTADAFRSRFPVLDYEAFAPYVQRVAQGDVGAMFPADTRILMFATTSGTTNVPKLLPVTETFYDEYRASWQYWGTGVYRDYPQLLGLSTLQFSSHWQVSRSPSGVPCGNISGLAAETRPAYMRSLFVLPSAVIRIMDHAAKHYTALRISLASNRVGKVITANPSTLIEVAKRADREKESLIRDLFDGTLSKHVDVSPAIRKMLRPHLRKSPARARELESLAERTGHLYPKDAWPRLTLLAVWTGGAVGIYLPQLEQYYGDLPVRDHGISASEGRMTIPLSDRTQAGLLDYTSHYYEFIPEQEHGSKNPTILEAHELQPGSRYFILLTTSAGLFRYDISDVVCCEGYEGEVPLLSFMNKGRHFANFTGEKLSEHQVVQAMTESLQSLGLQSCTFTLAPRMRERPQYRLLLDSADQLQERERLARELQRRLEQINIEYADKCRSGRIDTIEVHEIPAGSWDRLRAKRSGERGNFEEYKHPCLTNDLGFIDRVQALSNDEQRMEPGQDQP